MKKKEIKIIEVKFKAKPRIILKTSTLRNFNDCEIIIKAESIIVIQKNQRKKLILVNIKDNAKK